MSRGRRKVRAQSVPPNSETEFGDAPGQRYNAKAILLINFCLPEVNKSPCDTGDTGQERLCGTFGDARIRRPG